MGYPIFHDFVALLFVYNDVLKESPNHSMRDATMKKLNTFFFDEDDRVLRHKDYFCKNQIITESYKFVSAVIKYIVKQNSNPKHTWYLGS